MDILVNRAGSLIARTHYDNNILRYGADLAPNDTHCNRLEYSLVSCQTRK